MDDDERKIDEDYWKYGDPPPPSLLDEGQCPRCGGSIPNNETPGMYPGALSRYDNATEICSECGTQEAMIQFQKGGHRGDGNTLEGDHNNWYVVMIESIICATTKEEAQGVLIRLLSD
jgi:ribosomal protein S27AE